MLACQAQKRHFDNPIEEILHSDKDMFGHILADSNRYEVQIIYTQIDRDSLNRPQFKTYQFNVDTVRYFYPASMVKLPAALLALEKLNQLNISKESIINFGKGSKPQKSVEIDSTARNFRPSIGHYLKKLFVVSDNDAFNRLYEFLGQAQLNEDIWAKGYQNMLILHRLANKDFDLESNRCSNPFVIFQENADSSRQVLLSREEVCNPKIYRPKLGKISKGKAYTTDEGDTVKAAFDFTYKNYFALPDMQRMLRAVLFPESMPDSATFDIRPEDYQYLYKCMSMLPRESNYPKYEEKYHTDGFMKFLLYGDTKEKIPAHIRIFNKVGLSYGFMSDNAYIVDFKNRVEFMLSVVIYTNKNQILNDGKYEYKDIAYPFMRNLGRKFLAYEQKRPRKYPPNLQRFQLSYED